MVGFNIECREELTLYLRKPDEDANLKSTTLSTGDWAGNW